MAFAHYAAATGDSCYALVAHDMLAALVKSTQCADDLQGFGSRLPPYPTYYRSTEHNTDMLSLARMLGSDGSAAQQQAHAFVHGMWARLLSFNASYADGTGGATQCDATVPLAPSPLAPSRPAPILLPRRLAPSRISPTLSRPLSPAHTVAPPQVPTAAGRRWTRSFGTCWPTPTRSRRARRRRWALRCCRRPSGRADARAVGDGRRPDRRRGRRGRGAQLQGVRFTTWGNGIQWENTASAVMAMAHYRRRYGFQQDPLRLGDKLAAARDSLKHLLAATAACRRRCSAATSTRT